MNYKIEFHIEAKKEFLELDGSLRKLVAKQIKKLESSPELGDDLGNRAGMDLSGYKKLYVASKKVRIVYKVVDEKVEVFVVAIGKRDDMDVYKKANERVN